jgi:hypothetical protein
MATEARIKTGTKVRLNPNWDRIEFHRGAGIGIVVGKWFNDYTVSFGRTKSIHGDMIPYHVVVPGKHLIIVSHPRKGYRHPKSPTYDRVWDFTRKLHGSGINYNWDIEETGTSFRASNQYDTMDEAGYYDVAVPFTIIFPKNESMGEFKLQFESGFHKDVEKYTLREYLEDVIAYTLDELKLR